MRNHTKTLTVMQPPTIEAKPTTPKPPTGEPGPWYHRDEDAAFLRGLDIYGHAREDENREYMSVVLKYFDADDELKEENQKTKKLWMYRRDAIDFAQGVIEQAMRTRHDDMEKEMAMDREMIGTTN
jgi:hypothetical protein